MSKLDLLLVNVGSSKKKVYQDLSKDYSAIEPPFWAALTAGFIRDKGYNVQILDANAENLTYEETAKTISELNPEMTNFVVYGQQPSASTQLMTSVEESCKFIKNLEPERKIILTGLHPSALPERTLREDSCDFVGQGEGFYTLLGLLENRDPKNIPGLWWKRDNQVFNNPRAKNVENLSEELKDVAWDLLPMDKYKAHNWQCLDNLESRPKYASLSTSLGCPFKCNFCSIHATFGERKVRYWDPKWVGDQITTLAEDHGVEIFKIIDETFILNPKHYLGVAEELTKKGFGEDINMWAYARVDTTKEDHLDKLRKAGLKWICYGFESGNDAILREAHKGKFTREDMLDISKKTKEHGINIIANYMFGFPGDTQESMQETLDLAKEQNCEFANFYCAIAWPGSDLYNEALEKNIPLPETWANYAQHAYGFIPMPTRNLTPQQVLRFRDNAFNEFFINPKYLKMIESKFGKKSREHIEGMTKLNLKRKIFGD